LLQKAFILWREEFGKRALLSLMKSRFLRLETRKRKISQDIGVFRDTVFEKEWWIEG
jgi:hypothetical protein